MQDDTMTKPNLPKRLAEYDALAEEVHLASKTGAGCVQIMEKIFLASADIMADLAASIALNKEAALMAEAVSGRCTPEMQLIVDRFKAKAAELGVTGNNPPRHPERNS